MELFKLLGTITIDASGATKTIEGVLTAGKDLETVLNKAGTETDNFGAKLGENGTFGKAAVWAGNMLADLTKKAVEFAGAFAKTGIDFNSSMEVYQASLKTLFRLDDAGASALLDKLYAFAVETPYAMKDVMAAANTLAINGVAEEELFDYLYMIGEMTGGKSENYGRIVKAITEINAQGELKPAERNQLVNAGIPIYSILADYGQSLGQPWLTEEYFREAVASPDMGNPTAEYVMAALFHATNEGGRYHGRMAAHMETFAGQQEKLNDAYEKTAGALTVAFFDVLKSDAIPGLSNILDKLYTWATENPELLSGLAESMSVFVTNGIDVLVTGLTGLLEFFEENEDSFTALVGMLGAIAFTSGHKGVGLALLGLAGYDVLTDEAEEIGKEMSGLSSDVDLPFVKQQLEAQGKGADWEPYLEAWKAARRDEGYDDTAIEAFIEEQFADQKRYLRAPTLLEKFNYAYLDKLYGEGASDWYYRDVGVFKRTDGGGRRWEDISPDDIDVDGTGGSLSQLRTDIQSLIAAISTQNAGITDAISAGMSGVTITGTVTNSNVMLETGALVGAIMPRLNLRMGTLNNRDLRGV